MTKISDVYGKTFGPGDNDQDNSHLEKGIFDPGSHEAKLQEARAIPTSMIYDRNGKDNNQESKKRVHFVQKHTQNDLIAEAVIVAGNPYFAVTKANSNEITLEKSLPITGTSEYRPFESGAYLNKPIIFKSKMNLESCVDKARRETLDTLYRKEVNLAKIYRCR